MVTAASKLWVPDRRDLIWINFNPQIGSAINETNPFAIKHLGPKGDVGYVLSHQPKSFDWRLRGARARAWKQVSPTVFESACEGPNSIISIGA